MASRFNPSCFFSLLASCFSSAICQFPFLAFRFSILVLDPRFLFSLPDSRFAGIADRASSLIEDSRRKLSHEDALGNRQPSLIIRLRPSLDPSESSQ